MESFASLLILVLAVIIALILVAKMIKFAQPEQESQKALPIKPKYYYARRNFIMSQSEARLFRRLEVLCGDRYYIFPQVHLSSLLDHKAYKQDWRAALAAIQRKSVDFALVDKATLETRYAVELDDSTHDMPDRQLRDGKVEAYLSSVRIPLVRLRNVESMTDDEIGAEFEKVHEG